MGLPDELKGLKIIVEPWYESLSNPGEAQERVLRELSNRYSTTRYGEGRGASEVVDIEGFRRRFPVLSYSKLEPLLEEARRGGYDEILSEPPVCWVMTRGTTGTSKVLPATRTHLDQILSCGARAVINQALRGNDPRIVQGKFLNLSLPSRVATINVGSTPENYGYSSGTYSRVYPSLGGSRLTPAQEEIDAIGPGISKRDWDRRFMLVYSRAKDEDVAAAIGVAPVLLSFARFVKKRLGRLPMEIWDAQAIFATSVRKIPIRYAPLFRKYFGAPTVEIYSATEGVFAQQLDDLPYVTPNYDKFLFEVDTHGGFKMLHELRRGEWGRLIVSTCMFPRYDIGDMVESEGKNYFRVFGRARARHILEHRLHRLLFGWFL